MELPPLDVSTLFVVSALVIAFSGCVLIVARGRDEGAAALVFWGAAMLLGALGIVLLSLVPFTAWPARAAGNVAILLGAALSWTGARVFAGRRARPLLVCAGPASWLAAHALVARATGASGFLIGAGYILASAAELWRGRTERLPTRGPAIAFLVTHGAIYLWQAAMAVVRGADVPHGTFLFLLLEALLHTTGMAFLFLALMKERAERRSTLQLRELATQDGLTGLGNRRDFDGSLAEEFRRAARLGVPLGLLMIDVDHFKAFNDTYGHLAGDDCLRAVAECLRAAVRRAGDRAARYGGEEFAVLLPRTDAAAAAAMAEEVRSGIERLGIAHGGSGHGVVTASIGAVSMVPVAAEGPEVLVRAADGALYEAKAMGRNAVRVAVRVVGRMEVRAVAAGVGRSSVPS